MCPDGGYWGFNSSKNVQKHQRGCQVFSLAVLFLMKFTCRKCHHNMHHNIQPRVGLGSHAFYSRKVPLLTQLTHTTHHTRKHPPHHTTPPGEKATHGPSSLGPVPVFLKCHVLPAPTRHARPECLASELLFMSARADRKRVGRDRNRPPLAGPAETAHGLACFVLYDTRKSFARELTNPKLD